MSPLSTPLAVGSLPIFFSTHYQRRVPPETSVAYFDALTAPSKKLLWFEESGHGPFVDEPTKSNRAMEELLLLAHVLSFSRCTCRAFMPSFTRRFSRSTPRRIQAEGRSNAIYPQEFLKRIPLSILYLLPLAPVAPV